MLPNLDVTAVIVNYNAGKLLTDSVRQALLQVQQIIVIDNASHDDSLQLLEATFCNEVRVKVIRFLENKGFAAGCNYGANLSTTPYILFLNPDCFLQANCINRLSEVISQQKNIGMVGGLLVDKDGIEQRGARRYIPTLRQKLLLFLLEFEVMVVYVN